MIRYLLYNTLIINIIRHEFVPKNRVVSLDERSAILEKYDIVNYNQLPIILKTDPVIAKFSECDVEMFVKLHDP